MAELVDEEDVADAAGVAADDDHRARVWQVTVSRYAPSAPRFHREAALFYNRPDPIIAVLFPP